MLKTMRVAYSALFIFISALAWSAFSFLAHADFILLETVVYEQTDDTGDITSVQPNFQNTYISANLGNLTPGKGVLTITFTMKDPNASIASGQPGGVALGTCATCQDLQKYLFTNADRTLLSDGAFHTFTVQTVATTYDDADGTVPIYINFFNLSQYHNSTHLKSNSSGTIPTLTITTPTSPPPIDISPEGSITVYSQDDRTAVMTNPQATFQNAFIDSVSLGNLALGQNEVYLTFTIKDPNASNANEQPSGVCIQEVGSTGCASPLQTYLFTDADRTLLSDGGFHTFNVETGTTTSSYADGTQPVSIGFFGLSQYQYGTKIKSNASQTIPALVIKALPQPDPCAVPGACASNVLFLPGIEGSRLYEGMSCGKTAEEKLWDPVADSIIKILRGAGDDKVKRLFLDSTGKSVCSDIYTKTDGVIDSVRGNNIYKSFIDEMNGLETDGTINDWKPVAYDWRLSLTDLLNKGAERDGKIFYTEATSTPYIEQTFRALASSSKTGKVTIVAHSNGGLVAKALLKRLGSEASKSLVDDIIFVGVPQSGAPRAVGSLLYGTGEGLPLESFDFILSKAVAREFSENSPMAYHLLPSEQYFADVNDSSHSVGTFTGISGFAKERAAYGSTIDTEDELYDFLLALEDGREKPATNDVSEANVLNESLIDYARDAHSTYDAWLPPTEITLYQVAGWGVDTVAGLRFTELPPILAGPFAATNRNMFSPTFIEDGDSVVPVPSALMTSTSSPNVKRYWMNLDVYRTDTSIKRTHRDLFEIPSLQDFIKNILKDNMSTLPAYISESQPSPITANKKLVFILHSPLTLQLTDSSGNVTGLSENDSVTENISGATYGEFGEAKYIIAPEGNYTLNMNGQASGTFTLEMQEMTGNDTTASVIIANVPATSDTLASLTISGGIDTASALTVDEDGDGATDITITPQMGETVNYEPPVSEPESAPEPQTSSSSSSGGGGGGWSSIPVPAPIATTTASTSSPQATTTVIQTVATSTSEFATSTPITQVNKKSPVPAIAVNNAQEAETSKKVENIPQTPLEIRFLTGQTASVYDAVSQQSVLKKLGVMVYNGLHGLWLAIMRFF